MGRLTRWVLRRLPDDWLREQRPDLYREAHQIDGWRLLWRVPWEGGGWMKTETFRERYAPEEARYLGPWRQVEEPITPDEVTRRFESETSGWQVVCEEIPEQPGFGPRIWQVEV